MSYMRNMDATLREMLGRIATDGDREMIDDTVKFIKDELLKSFNNGIATVKYNAKRKTTPVPNVRRVARKS